MLGKQPAATNDDVSRPEPKAAKTTRPVFTTRSVTEKPPPTVASLGRRAMGFATTPRPARIHNMSNDVWNDISDRKFFAQEGAGLARMQAKQTKITTPPQTVDKPAAMKAKPVGDQADIPPEPVSEHEDLTRWKEDEQEHLEQEEKKRAAEEAKRNAENLELVLKRIAEVEQQQQQQQRCEETVKAFLAAFCLTSAIMAKKADQEQVDQQARDLASLHPDIDKVKEEAASLQTQCDDMSERVDLVEREQGATDTALEALTKSDLELRGRVHVLENQPPVTQVNIANLGADATAIAADEQPQANTGGSESNEVSALTDKTDGHDQRLERLETAMSDVVPKMERASPWCEWVSGELQTAAQHFSEHKDIPNKVKDIEATHERQSQALDEALAKQKEAFEEKLRQQKEDSDKAHKALEESMQEHMRLREASIRKECEERIVSQEKQFAEHVAKAEAKAEAEKKEQNERQNQMETKMNDFMDMMQAQIAAQQAPAPAQGQQQQQPEVRPPQPTPLPQATGPWGAPTNQGPQPVSRLDELDDVMEDAAPETPQQPSEDTPMTSDEPMVPNNNGNMGFGTKPQPMGSNQPFARTGPLQPPFQAPIPPAAPSQGPSQPAPFARATPTEKRGDQLQRSIFAPGAPGPKLPAGQQGFPNPTATPAKAPAPSGFGYNGPPPTVNKPQINWSASTGQLNFDPPAGMDIDSDDDMPLAPKARRPLVNAAPATPSSRNFGGSDTVMTNGPSSTAGGPSSTPAKPQAPAPTKPKPAKKKADPMVQRKPGATPSKPAQTTNKAQTTTTKMASYAQMKQAAFASQHGSTPAPKATLDKTTALPSEEPSEEPSEFNIPGLTGAVNTSPFALKPKVPAPVPKPAPPTGYTTVIAGTNPATGGFGAVSPVYRAATVGSSSPTSPNYSATSAVHSTPSPAYSPAYPTWSPTSPTYHPAAPAPKPYTSSPLANPAATSGTIESTTTTNVFSKEVEKPVEKPTEANGNSAPEQANGEAGGAATGGAEPAKPVVNADDIQMSGAEKEHKFEVDVNRRKHAADVQIVPNDAAKTHRRESQDDAKAHKPQEGAKAPEAASQDDSMGGKQESQGDDPMQTDRPTAKPKSRGSKLTPEEKKRIQDKFDQQAAWDEMDKAFEHKSAQAVKAAADAADDVVDYGDPNDVNDEDVHVTTMAPPRPNVRPTLYTINFFNDWKAHILSEKNLTNEARRLETESSAGIVYFIQTVMKQDEVTTLDTLLEQAGLARGKPAYTRSEMVRLFSAFREEVLIQSMIILDLDDVDPGLSKTKHKFMIDMTHYFFFHDADAI